MLKVFINYRREDTAGYVGRLYDHLLAHFDQQDIFHDIDSIDPGTDFGDVINDAIANSGVVLAVIGRQWADIRDPQGNRRLDDPRDLVRMEIATALQKGTVVLPVLVGGAILPPRDQLPKEIADLTRRHAVDLSDKGFKESVAALADRIKPWLIPSGRETEVSTLLCEIRGFTRISERLGSEDMFRSLGDIMQALSESVRDHEGFLIDYASDQLFAMWGAPVSHDDHPERACRAALDMLSKLPAFNDRWNGIDLGIGVNTGRTVVGNIGSRIKVKFTPLGPPVKTTKDILDLTRPLQTRLLVGETTQSRLGPGFSSRRITKVRAMNSVEPINVFEVALAGQPDRDKVFREYEVALTHFENGEFRPACRGLASLVTDPEERPSLILMARALKCLAVRGGCDPVFDPSSW